MKMKKLLALLLALCMMVSLLPGTAIAVEATAEPSATPEAQSSAEPTAAATAAATETATPEPTESAEPVKGEESTPAPAASEEPVSEPVEDEALTEEEPAAKPETEEQVSVMKAGDEIAPLAAENQTTRIYIYAEVTGSKEGLVQNDQGWFTLGYVDYPGVFPEGKVNDKLNNIKDDVVEYAKQHIVHYEYNRGIDINNVTFQNLWWKDGASSYVPHSEGKMCLHLDGKVSGATLGTVTYKYVCQDSNGYWHEIPGYENSVTYQADATLTFGESKEGYKNISGYAYHSVSEESYTVKRNQEKVITYRYYKMANYTVEFYYQNEDGSYPTSANVKDSTRTQKWSKNTLVSVTTADKADKNYNGVAYTLDTDKNDAWSATLQRDGTTVLKLYFKRSTASYTIHHYLKGTTVEVAPSQTDSANVGSKLTAARATNLYTEYRNANVASYAPAQTITIGTTGENVINVYYTVPLTLTAKDASKPYDGQPLTQPGFTAEGLVNGDKQADITLNMTDVSTITNVTAGGVSNVINESTIKVNSKAVSESYYTVTTVPGTLTINPREIVLKTEGDTKEYNGEPLTKKDYIVDGEFVDGQGFGTVTVTGSQTEVGSSTNTVEYTLNDKTNSKNYTITKELGTLTVTQNTTDTVEVVIKGKTKTVTYNGKEQTFGGDSDAYEITSKPADVTVTPKATVADRIARGTDANTAGYLMGLTANDFEVSSNNYTKFKVTVVDGKLFITPLTVTVTVNDNTVVYDGNLHGAKLNGNDQIEEGVSYTVTGLADGHKLKDFRVEFQTANVGTYKGKLEPTYTIVDSEDKDVTSNYTRIDTSGTLTITANKNTITITAANDTQVYDGTALTNGGYTVTYDGQVYTATAGQSVTLPTGDVLTATVKGSATNVNDEGKNTVESWVIKHGETDVTSAYGRIQTTDGKLTITKRPVKVTANDNTVTYDGQWHGAKLNGEGQIAKDESYTVENLVNGHYLDGITIDGKEINAGVYENKLEPKFNRICDGDDNNVSGNYSVTSDFGTLTINPINDEIVVKITGNTDTVTYSGTEQKVEGYTAVISNPLYAASNITTKATALAKGTDANTEENPYYKMGLEKSDFSNTNENFKNVTFVIVKDGWLKIEPRKVTLESETASKVYDGGPLTKPTVAVTGSFVNGEVSNIRATGSVTYVHEGSVKNTIAYDTAPSFKASNYSITKNEGTLTITPRAEKIIITTPTNSKVYDGKALVDYNHTHTGTLLENDTLIVTFRNSSAQTDVGSHANEFGSYCIEREVDGVKTDVTSCYTFGTHIIGTLTVTARPVTVTADDREVEYNGTEQGAKDGTCYTVSSSGKDTGLVSGHTLEGITISGGKTEVGTYAKELKPSGAKIVDNDGNDVTSNYAITYVPGTLTITKSQTLVQIEIIGNSDTQKYDGDAHTVTGFTFTAKMNGESIPTGDFKVSLKDEYAGKDTITGTDAKDYYWMPLYAEYFNVTSEKYGNIEIARVQWGSLTITKREVTLASDTASKTYDGTALTRPNVTVTGDGFVEGEASDIKAIGSVTNVSEGTVTNAITYTTGDKFKADNYTITKSEGTLHIDPITAKVTVTVTEKSDSVTYDGSEHSIKGYKSMVADNDLYKVTTSVKETETAAWTAKGTNANTYPVGIVAGDFENTNENFTDVEFVIEDGALTIDKAPEAIVEVKGNTATYTYDGAEKSVTGYTVTGNPANADVKLVGAATATGTNAGTYSMGLTAASFNASSPNYEKVTVKVTDGGLKINPITAETTVKVSGNTGTVVYNGLPKTVEGFTVAKDTDKTITVALKPGKTAKATGTLVNTYPMGLTAEHFNVTSPNYTNIKLEITDGWLTITPNPNEKIVTITGNNDTVTYDGKEHSVTGYTYVDEEKVITVTLLTKDKDTASGTEPGTYNMGLTAADFSVRSKNYTNIKVVVIDGYLTIEPDGTPVPTPTTTPGNDEPTPAPEIEEIDENETPEAGYNAAWALINLICAILTVVFSVILLVGLAGKNKKTEEDDSGEEVEKEIKKKKFWRIFSIVPALAAVIVFLLTENMRLPMVLVDRWTLLMVIIALVQVLVMVFGKKTTKDPEEEAQA